MRRKQESENRTLETLKLQKQSRRGVLYRRNMGLSPWKK